MCKRGRPGVCPWSTACWGDGDEGAVSPPKIIGRIERHGASQTAEAAGRDGPDHGGTCVLDGDAGGERPRWQRGYPTDNLAHEHDVVDVGPPELRPACEQDPPELRPARPVVAPGANDHLISPGEHSTDEHCPPLDRVFDNDHGPTADSGRVGDVSLSWSNRGRRLRDCIPDHRSVGSGVPAGQS